MEHPLDMFDIRPVANKRKGLVATRDIPRRTSIASQTPLVVVDGDGPIQNKKKCDKQLVEQLARLTVEQQKSFDSFSYNGDEMSLLNACEVMQSTEIWGAKNLCAYYPTLCFLNHSCLPNAHYYYNEETNMGVVHAVIPIKKGDEVTIQYKPGQLSSFQPQAARKSTIQRDFGFDCVCELCLLDYHPDVDYPLLGHVEPEISDGNRAQRVELYPNIFQWRRRTMRSTLKTCLSDGEKFIHMIWSEFGKTNTDIEIVLFYETVSERCREASDKVRAAYFERLAVEIREAIEGTDSPRAKYLKLQLELGGAFEACVWRRST